MLAELDPKPDQVTVTVNTSQMNVTEHMARADFAGTSHGRSRDLQCLQGDDRAGQPGLGRGARQAPVAAGIQSAFQFYNINSFETVERMIRRGVYKGPLV
jgi:hypothetical protein